MPSLPFFQPSLASIACALLGVELVGRVLSSSGLAASKNGLQGREVRHRQLAVCSEAPFQPTSISWSRSMR